MKRPYFAYYACLVSVFGLISCNSDMSHETQFITSPIEQGLSDTPVVEIRNSDETFQKIAEITELRVSGYIEISSQNDQWSQIKTRTDCRTNFLQERVQHETILNPTDKIAVKDILPPRVFQPHSLQEEANAWCDLHVEMFSIDELEIKIQIQDVKMNGLDAFNNLQPTPFVSANPIYLMSELAGQSLLAPSENLSIDTLCKGTHAVNYFKNSSVPLNHILPEFIFQNSNNQVCRLLIRDEDTKEVWVTPKVSIQNLTSQLSYRVESQLTGSHIMAYNHQAVYQYHITNTGSEISYFKADWPMENIPAHQIYSWNSHVFSAHTTHFPATWHLLNPTLERTSQNPKERIYKLNPGETMTLALYLNGYLSCESGGGNNPTNQFSNSSFCQNGVYHRGQLYQFTGHPVLQESLYSDYTRNQWRTLNLIPTQARRDGRYLSVWIPNTQATQQCQSLSPIAHPRAEAPALPGALLNYHPLCGA
jgi:hypothetical protein